MPSECIMVPYFVLIRAYTKERINSVHILQFSIFSSGHVLVVDGQHILHSQAYVAMNATDHVMCVM